MMLVISLSLVWNSLDQPSEEDSKDKPKSACGGGFPAPTIFEKYLITEGSYKETHL